MIAPNISTNGSLFLMNEKLCYNCSHRSKIESVDLMMDGQDNVYCPVFGDSFPQFYMNSDCSMWTDTPDYIKQWKEKLNG